MVRNRLQTLNFNSEQLTKIKFKSKEFQEFVVAFNILSYGDITSRLEWIFEVYDINNDKSIDRKEIEIIIKVYIFVCSLTLLNKFSPF